jgi:hypothetical protein
LLITSTTAAVLTTKQIRTYLRPSDSKKVQIIATESVPVHGILTGFYMTAVLNVISWNKAYALFARETFVDRKSFMLKPVDDYFESLMHKYTRRGWRMEEAMPIEDHTKRSGIQSIRRLGDSHTWMITLPIDSMPGSTLLEEQPNYVLEASMFGVRPYVSRSNVARDRGGLLSYMIAAKPFQHMVLRHRYVVPSGSHYACCWRIGERLHGYARLGLLSMKKQDRPAWAQQGAQVWRSDDPQEFYSDEVVVEFKKRENWRVYDGDFPRWLERWLANSDLTSEEFSLVLKVRTPFG